MDEVDVVDRREAVAGLAFLGVLVVALTGSIAYRILDSTEKRPGRAQMAASPNGQQSGSPVAGAARSDGAGGMVYDGNVSPATYADEPQVEPQFVAPGLREQPAASR